MRYLIDEPPMMFCPSLAVMLGVNRAIFIQQIHFWICNYMTVEKKLPEEERKHWHAGHWWVYNTIDGWLEDNFPFWKRRTLERIIADLEDMGVVIYWKPAAVDWDHTKWYTINYERLEELINQPAIRPDDPDSELDSELDSESAKMAESNTPKWRNRSRQNGGISINNSTNNYTSTPPGGVGTEPVSDTTHSNPEPALSLDTPKVKRLYEPFAYQPPETLGPIDKWVAPTDNESGNSFHRKSAFGKKAKIIQYSLFVRAVLQATGAESLTAKQSIALAEIEKGMGSAETQMRLTQSDPLYPCMTYINQLIVWAYENGMAPGQFISGVRNEDNWRKFLQHWRNRPDKNKNEKEQPHDYDAGTQFENLG